MRVYFLIVGLGCALVLGARAIGSPGGTAEVASNEVAQEVTTYTGTYTLSLTMPGTPNDFGGVDFEASGAASDLQFDPNSIFAGSESAFENTSFTGTLSIPVSKGPANVNANCYFSSSGAVNGTWSSSDQGVSLGSNFSASNLDWTVGSTPGGQATNPSWQSNVIPELNNQSVTSGGNGEVTSVDAANGILTVSVSGGVMAAQQKMPPPPPPPPPGPGPMPG
jgi:hypothetical protein